MLLMKKMLRSISFFIALVMITGTLMIAPITSAGALTSASGFAKGSGTKSKPWEISTAEELLYFRDYINSASGAKKYFIITEDIDLGGYEWTESIGKTQNHFKSELDGGGHVISNFKLKNCLGFFDLVNTTTIKNLTLADVTADFTTANSGIFAYRVQAAAGDVLFENCHVVGTITTSAKAGGFAGYISNATHSITFKNCSTNLTVNTTSSNVGGFVGYDPNPAKYEGCSATATFVPTGTLSNLGGFIGLSYSANEFSSCTADVNISSSPSNQVRGGLIGKTQVTTTFEDCVSKGVINGSSSGENIGGFIGILAVPEPTDGSEPTRTTFTNCANLTSITAKKSIGGFIGHMNDSYVSFDGCYNAGPITATITDLKSVFISHFVSRATTNAYSRTSFTNNFVLTDVPLTGGKIWSKEVETDENGEQVPATDITNYCVIAYGGKDAYFGMYSEHFGMNDTRFTSLSKAEFFYLAAKGGISCFNGLGDVVTVGTQEKMTRNANGTYSLRLIAAIDENAEEAGFIVTLGSKTTTVPVKKAYDAIKEPDGTLYAPDGYKFITLVINNFDDNEYSLDYSAYIDKTQDFAKYIAGVHYVGQYDLDDGHTMKLYKGVTQYAYNKICQNLEAQGYTLRSENVANNNVFKTYYNSATGMMAHAYWVEYSEELRIVTAKTDLIPFVDTISSQTKYDVILHQLSALVKTDNPALIDGEKVDVYDGGMGYIIRLSDGRFLIIDGGNNTTANVKNIYDFLKANAPDPNKIVIAGWILTHGHGDHTGAFEGFANTYYKDTTITLNKILFNPCDTAEQTRFETFTTSSVRSTIASRYPNVPVYKPLSGQKYTFADTTVEILYTVSDYLPNTIKAESEAGCGTNNKNGNGNVQTMVFTVDLVSNDSQNNNFVVLGDTTTEACNEMCARYGEYLEAKYVQVSHHGIAISVESGIYVRRNNSTKELYKLINPEFAFWTTSDLIFNGHTYVLTTDTGETTHTYKGRATYEVNDYLINTLNVQNILASDSATARTIYFK